MSTEPSTTKPPKKPLDVTKLRPIEIHSQQGIHIGAKTLNTISLAKGAKGIIRASAMTATEMAILPGCGVVVVIGEAVTLVPFAVCDRIEMGE